MEDLPLRFSFQVKTWSQELGELTMPLGLTSPHFQLHGQRMPRSTLSYVTVSGIITTLLGEVFKEATVDVPVAEPNRTDSVSYLTEQVEDDMEHAAMMHDWYSFLDLAILAGNELIGQSAHEHKVYRQWHNASAPVNLSSLYAGLLPSDGGLAGLGFRSKHGRTTQHASTRPAHPSREEDLGGAHQELWEEDDLGATHQRWRSREEDLGAAHVELGGGQQRRLLAVPESLIEGLQLRLLGRLIAYSSRMLPQATPILLSKMSLALRLLTSDPTESTTKIQRGVLEAARQTARRGESTLPPGLAQVDYDNLALTLSQVHDMMMYDTESWDQADNTLHMRISLIDHAMTLVGASAVATGKTAKLLDNAPIAFSTRNLFSAAWRVSSGMLQPVLRAFWQGVSVEMRLNNTGILRPNSTRWDVKKSSDASAAAGPEDAGSEQAGAAQQQARRRQGRRLMQAATPGENEGTGGAGAGGDGEAGTAGGMEELELEREGDSRVVVHLYAQPPRPQGAFPYWAPVMDDSLLSSVYLVRITEGRWSSLSAKTLPTLELSFDERTATEEALVPVNNESSLYYRCHQYMPVFNTTNDAAPDGVPPRTWEDRQCVTTYPEARGQPLTCTCTLPDLRDQHDTVWGFEPAMPWTMVALRKSAPRCYPDDEFFKAQKENRAPVEVCAPASKRSCRTRTLTRFLCTGRNAPTPHATTRNPPPLPPPP